MSRVAPRFVVGGRWEADLAWLADHVPDQRIEAHSVRAPVDVVIAGRNITGFLPDEPVLPWLGALCTGLQELASGRLSKALIAFDESPWEIALTRHGLFVTVWLYEVVPPGRVVACVEGVALGAIIEAAQVLVEDLVVRVRALPPRRVLDDVLTELRTCARSVASSVAPQQAAPGATATAALVDTQSSAGFTLTSRIDAYAGLAEYRGEHGLDRHALLATGAIIFSPEAAPAVSLACRPIVALEQLVGALETAFDGDMEQGAPFTLVSADHDTLVAEMGRGRISLAVRAGAVASWHAEFDATDFLTVALEHVSDVVTQLTDRNPWLETNERLVELRDTADGLRVRLIRALGSPSVGPATRRPLSGARRAEPAGAHNAAPYPFEADNIHRMRHERAWSIRRTGVGASDVCIASAGRWLVRSEHVVEAIELTAGQVAWRHSLDQAGAFVALSADEVIVGNRDGTVAGRSVASGELVWRTVRPLPARVVTGVAWTRGALTWAVCDVDGGVHALRAGDVLFSAVPRPGVRQRVLPAGPALLCLGDDGAITGLDPATGAVAFRSETGLGRVDALSTSGGLVVIASAPLAGELLLGVMDPASGAWRTRALLEADGYGAVAVPGGAVSLIGLDDGLHLQHVDTETGREIATVSFNEAALEHGPASVRFDSGHVVVTQPGGMRAFDLERRLEPTWSFEPTQGRLQPVVMDGSVGMTAVLRDDDLLFISTRTGRVVHRVAAFWEELAALVIDERANIVVVERRADGSTTVHGVPAVGVLATVSSR